MDQTDERAVVTSDHFAVVAALRAGWADVGVCVQLPAVEAGLRFLAVRAERYDLCVPAGAGDDPRVRALVQTVRSAEFRELLADLPGYDSRETGGVAPLR